MKMSIAERATSNRNTPAELKPRAYVALAQQFTAGKTTPRAYLGSCLDAIARLDPQVGAFLVLNIEGALRAADDSTARWRKATTKFWTW